MGPEDYDYAYKNSSLFSRRLRAMNWVWDHTILVSAFLAVPSYVIAVWVYIKVT